MKLTRFSIALATAVLLAGGLVACSSGDGTGPTEEPTSDAGGAGGSGGSQAGGGAGMGGAGMGGEGGSAGSQDAGPDDGSTGGSAQDAMPDGDLDANLDGGMDVNLDALSDVKLDAIPDVNLDALSDVDLDAILSDVKLDAIPDVPLDAIPDVPLDVNLDVSADALPDTGLTDATNLDVTIDNNVPDAGKYDVQLWVVGDTASTPPSDGYQSQTPKKYYLGISKFQLLKSENDSTPALVFDYGADYKWVDMQGSTFVGFANLKDIPTGTYTWGKAKLDAAKFTIDTSVHMTILPTNPVSGTMDVLAALSNAKIGGTNHNKDWAEYTFHPNGYGSFTQTGTLPAMPSTSTGKIVETATETYLVFKFDQAMPVAAVPNMNLKVTMTVDVNKSFRWQDTTPMGKNYKAGQFDSEQGGSTEPIKNFGATGYHIAVTSSN